MDLIRCPPCLIGMWRWQGIGRGVYSVLSCDIHTYILKNNHVQNHTLKKNTELVRKIESGIQHSKTSSYTPRR